MARRVSPPEPQSANLSPEQMRRGVEKLKRRIADLEAFDVNVIHKRWDPAVASLEASIEETLDRVFGAGTIERNRYRSAERIDAGPLIMGGGPDPTYRVREWCEEGRTRSLALLGQAVKGLEEEITESDNYTSSVISNIPSEAGSKSRKVFVVHGHDDAARESVARFLEKIDFTPIILHEQPNKGRTIITKFREEAADIGFAVILMTPDDQGGKAGAETRPRARQNVVLELGFFLGALGPERVAALVRGDVERPSDFDGVVYISLDSGDWRAQLGKELQAAGFGIDWNKVMGG